MANFLSNNLGTILTGIGLLMIVTAIILNIFWDKKKNSAAGACAGCPCGCGNKRGTFDLRSSVEV